jgi:hypothetical protein
MVVAIVVGAVAQSVRQAPATPGGAEMFVIVGGVILGTIAGVVVALTHWRWYAAIFLGAPVGLVIGCVIGLLIAVPAGLPVLLAGCPLIVLYGVAVRFLSRPKDHETMLSDEPLPPETLAEGTPSQSHGHWGASWESDGSGLGALVRRSRTRSDRPWGARWDTPAAGVPRRFGVGILMLLMTLAAVLFSILRSAGANPEVFTVIASMVTAVAIGQVFLFRGRYPRAASIWVGSCFFPLQAIALCLWFYLDTKAGPPSPGGLIVLFMALISSVPIGAGFGYLCGGIVGGVFLILDALAKRRES